MPSLRTRIAARVREDRGSVSATMALGVAVAMLVLAFVTTVHGQNDAYSRADALASEAARAAETAVNTRGATITVDPNEAVAAARAYLAAAGVSGTVTITSPTRVRVTVTVDRPALWTTFGPSYHATASKDAVLTVGPHG